MRSFWNDLVIRSSVEELCEDLETQLLVIGAHLRLDQWRPTLQRRRGQLGWCLGRKAYFSYPAHRHHGIEVARVFLEEVSVIFGWLFAKLFMEACRRVGSLRSPLHREKEPPDRLRTCFSSSGLPIASSQSLSCQGWKTSYQRKPFR